MSTSEVAEAHFHTIELTLDHSKWMLFLRPHLSHGLRGPADRFVQGTMLAQFLVGTASCFNLPDERAPCMRSALLNSGIKGIGTHYVSLAVQQLIDLGIARDIRRCDEHSVHQVRLIVSANVCFSTDEILFSVQLRVMGGCFPF